MVKSLYTGVSGLKTHQQKMDVIGNNIANVNTTGYKTNVTSFADVYYQTKKSPSGTSATLGGVNPIQVGYGVKLNTTTPNMTQSGFTFSDSIYDMALDGEGFFQLMDGAGNLLYTRAGVFNIDESGYLVNASGYHVLGVNGDPTGQAAGSEAIRITIPDTEAHCSSATKRIAGTDVTISVSAPSNNTDMTITFTNAEYPYATFANGILNVFFNMDGDYRSVDDFQNAITEAINAGGVTLPDDVELKFEFATLPDNIDAEIAKNSVSGWSGETTIPSGEIVQQNALGEAEAYIGFAAKDAMKQNDVPIQVVLTYNSGGKNTATVTGHTPAVHDDPNTTANEAAAAVWNITVGPEITASDINEAIQTYIDANPNTEGITCTKFLMPSDATQKASALSGFSGTTIELEAGKFDVNFNVEATVAGAYANNYKVVYQYSATYGDPKAVWDENTLTITVTNNSTQDQINEAIMSAAAGDKKKELKISGLAPLLGGTEEVTSVDAAGNITTTTTTYAADSTNASLLNAAMREAFFGGNPAVSLGGGKDTFYTEVAKSLTTFALENGRTGSPQSYKDLENVTVQQDGTIIGLHAVHGYINLGRIDIATFDNPNGLSAIGGTTFMETVASGEAKLSIAGQSGAGEIVSGALEMSNVDLAQEFTDMITTQRGYQANSRVITTSDTMLEELLNLKR